MVFKCKQPRISCTLFLGVFITLSAVSNAAAQNKAVSNQAKSRTVVDTQTDTVFANKTTVYTRAGISDAKVLEEIVGDYSLGDEVRITIAPPPKRAPEKEEVPIKERVVVASKMKSLTPPTVLTLEQALTPGGNTLPVGAVIRTQHMQFSKDASKLEAESFPYLDGVYQYLKDHPAVIIEVGGHTNLIPSHEYSIDLSVARARAIVSYLVAKGIEGNRLRTRGYGRTQPLLLESTEKAHKMNQRVELKVLYNN